MVGKFTSQIFQTPQIRAYYFVELVLKSGGETVNNTLKVCRVCSHYIVNSTKD